MCIHALALVLPSPDPPPLAVDEAGVLAAILLKAAAALLVLVLLPLPLLLASALRQLPAADECELQNESYVSRVVVLCMPVPTDVAAGPGAVGMSNVLLDGRKEDRGSAGGCVDAGGGCGGFCEGVRVRVAAGERVRLDVVDGDAFGGAGAGAGGVEVGTDVGAGVGVGVGEGEGE